MAAYLKQHKLDIAVLSGWLVLLNIYKVVFHVVGVDTEQALISLDSNLNWTLGSGRFASAFLRKLLMPYGFNYDIAMLITILGWLLVCLSFQYLLERYASFPPWCCLLFSLLFVSCPIWAEQSYFVCSFFVNVLGILFTVWSAALLTEMLQNQAPITNLVPAVLLAALAIAIYQALLFLLAAECILFLSLNAYTKRFSFPNYLKSGFLCIGVLIVATIIYFICSKICVFLFYDPTLDYAGFTSAASYMSNNLRWRTGDFTQCLGEIKDYFLRSIAPHTTYGIPFFPIVWSVLQVLFLLRLFVRKESRALVILLGNFLLFVAVYLECLLMGGSITVREQFVLPLATAFLSAFLANEIAGFVFQKTGNKRFRRAATIALTAVCAYGVLAWGSKQLLIHRSDYVRYISDVAFANTIMDEASAMGNLAQEKIIFVGCRQWSPPESYPVGEVIGTSVFSWDLYGPVGANYRANGFLQSLGYQYSKPTREEIQRIRDLADITDLFAGQRIVRIDGYVVIDLGRY